MATVRESGLGFGVDTSDLKELATYMRRAARDSNLEFRRGLRKVGDIVADEARKKAAEHSTKVAVTIKVRTSGASVSVVAGNADVPEAALLELGNSGDKRSAVAGGGTFRHPVFGNRDNWVKQRMHPYLKPAARAKQDDVVEALQRVVNESLESLGFEVE